MPTTRRGVRAVPSVSHLMRTETMTHYGRLRLPLLATGALASMLATGGMARAEALGTYNIDPESITVSGISSGADLAHQLHIAYSGTFKHAGLLAGTPFACAKGDLGRATSTCSSFSGFRGPPDVDDLVQLTRREATANTIDDPANLAGSKVWLWVGRRDRYVPVVVMEALEEYYKKVGVNQQNIVHIKTVPAEHAMITNHFGSSCATFGTPYINNCKAEAGDTADAAGNMLKLFYGNLNQPAAAPEGTLAPFHQTDFVRRPARYSLAETGHVYVPRACADGVTPCRLHVALHGCDQNDAIFPNHAGYNRWADANNIVVLYPRAIASQPNNPNGCWDWWGYTSKKDYYRRSGPQMMAIKAMVNHAAGLFDAPAAVTATPGPGASVDLAWLPLTAKNVQGYNVYRSTRKPVALNQQNQLANAIPAATFRDSNRQPNTKYYYNVTAVDVAGKESGRGPDVTPITGCCTISPAGFNLCHAHACDVLCSTGAAVCD